VTLAVTVPQPTTGISLPEPSYDVMTAERELIDTWSPRALGVVRIVTGLLFMEHGTAKLLGHPNTAMFDGLQLFSLMGVAGVNWLAACPLPWGYSRDRLRSSSPAKWRWPISRRTRRKGSCRWLISGEAAVLYCFFFLYLFVAGSSI
jgi:putative oxidoreductase